MTKLYVLLLLGALFPLATEAMDLNDRLNFITTSVAVSGSKEQSSASAFFYHRLSPKDPTKKGRQWRAVQDTWLVTNRHVVLQENSGKEILPETFTFHLRKYENSHLEWEPIALTRDELFRRAKFHNNPSIDIVVIKVQDLILDRLSKKEPQSLQFYGVSREDFSGENKIEVQASDDVVVVGYPRGFYDSEKLFPIVKSGIIASRWGTNFGGKPYFLIDAKLFPGSSGSLVLSKPTHVVMSGGQLLRSDDKQFAFLGIYSAEFFKEGPTIETDDLIITQKQRFNLGIVWYAWLIENIIDNGVEFKP